MEKEVSCDDCTTTDHCYVHLVLLDGFHTSEAQEIIRKREKDKKKVIDIGEPKIATEDS